jgi:hypothetical protein
MTKWPVPTNFTKLRRFLGLTRYYRKFVGHYGALARPLTNLLHPKSFKWTKVAQEAFDRLKQAMVSTLVLAFPDFSKEFIVEVDACETDIGAILSQGGHPIAYFSKGLSMLNQRLTTYERNF